MKFWLRNLMLVYLLLLLAVWGAIAWDQGDTWWVSLFLFSPRWVVGVPWLLLFPLTLIAHPKAAAWYVLHLALLLFVVLDFRWPLTQVVTENDNLPHLRLLTCNLGEGPIRVEQLADLVTEHHVEVVLLQECSAQVGQELFQLLGWDHQQAANLAIGSAHPSGKIKLLVRRGAEAYGAPVAAAVDIPLRAGLTPIADTAAQTAATNWVRVISVHLPTFRPAFEKAEQFAEGGQAEFASLATLYREFAELVLDETRLEKSAVVLGGDFNVPVESDFYRDYWSSFQNALSLQGHGLCYTKYTRFHGVRIDHVLADENWIIRSAQVGPALGGDHRPVIVDLSLAIRPTTTSQ